MKESIKSYLSELILDLYHNDTSIIIFAILLIIALIILDAISSYAKKKRKATGLNPEIVSLKTQHSKPLPVKNYISEIQGLSGRPDAIIHEKGYLIPVERKPLSKKLRDRHVSQVLVYMRLIEEFEGKRPPYGYIILGKKCRKVKIKNTDQKQQWLQKYLDEMNSILNDQAGIIARPLKPKCMKCPVRKNCPDRAC